MRVLVIGGSGYVGKAVVKNALERGHEVTALLRNPDAVPDGPKLRKVKGDALDPAAVREAVKGQDAVIDAIGLSSSSKPKRGGDTKRGDSTTLFSESARVLVEAMNKPKNKFRVSLDGKVGMMMTVPDSAKFLVDQLEDRTYVGKTPSVSN